MIPIDADFLHEVTPTFSGRLRQNQHDIIEAVAGDFQSTLERYEINTMLRIAHFMGQIVHESAGMRTTQEFASGAAYEGRRDLGNTRPGDGKRYKGRGLLQLTGRENYRVYGEAIGEDLEGNPEAAAEPVMSLVIACEYWKRRKINPDCDRDDLIAVTKKVNGGTNGLADRRKYLGKAKTALQRIIALDPTLETPPESRPILRRGSRGSAVVDLQELLRDHDIPLTIDGDFGPATDTAVRFFQGSKGLVADGIVGANTWKALIG